MGPNGLVSPRNVKWGTALFPVVALLDTCVLYPRYVRDALLSLAETGLYKPQWSEDILEELGRNLLEDGLPPDRIEWLLHEMRETFPEAMVSGYQTRIDSMRTDPKDRHVAAAAVECSADVIVTDNLRDFPQEALAPFQLEAQSADEFLTYLLTLDPRQVTDALSQLVAAYRKPPLRMSELINILAKRTPRFASHLAEAFERYITGER